MEVKANGRPSPEEEGKPAEAVPQSKQDISKDVHILLDLRISNGLRLQQGI